VTVAFAFECFADQEIFQFLRIDLQLPLLGVHSDSQGEVINHLLLKGRARIGMVDEDPFTTHHAERDRMEVLRSTDALEYRRAKRDGIPRHLLIVRPDLESCFLRSLNKLGLESKLARGTRELHRLLGKRRSRYRSVFREDLKSLHSESKGKRTSTFITELEDILRQILSLGT